MTPIQVTQADFEFVKESPAIDLINVNFLTAESCEKIKDFIADLTLLELLTKANQTSKSYEPENPVRP